MSNYDELVTAYNQYLSEYSELYVNGLFREGIISKVDADKLKVMFANPDYYQDEIDELAQYYYVINAEIHQMFDLIEALPNMNYKVDNFTKSKDIMDWMLKIEQGLNKMNHRRLTRDILKQLTSAGNLIGIWLGGKNPFPFVFDDCTMVRPMGRDNRGDFVCAFDLSWFNSKQPLQQEEYFKLLSPYVTRKDYDKYLLEPSHKTQFKLLPKRRTFFLRTGALKRNQVIGTSWITSGMMDVLHKEKMKDVEQTIANKIINEVATLTIGSEKEPKENGWRGIPKQIRNNIYANTKRALESTKNGTALVALPEFAKLAFTDMNTDGLNPNKFDQVNSDIKASFNLSGALLNGEGTNYNSSKMNLDIFYKKLAVLLEDIENEVYRKYFNIVVPKEYEDTYFMEYDKQPALTTKEKLDQLSKLSDKGWSIKYLVTQLDINWDAYLSQTLYETEELKLQDKIKPYLTSNVISKNDQLNGSTRIADKDLTNENTIRNRQSYGKE